MVPSRGQTLSGSIGKSRYSELPPKGPDAEGPDSKDQTFRSLLKAQIL